MLATISTGGPWAKDGSACVLPGPSLRLEDIGVHRDGRRILEIDALDIGGREFTVILGQNGSGKSTLLRLLARQLTPDRGRIWLGGEPLAALGQRAFARAVAYLPQHLPTSEDILVAELVKLGRFPWRGLLGSWRPQDAHIVAAAMEQADVLRFADARLSQLSGGELQRAWLAMLLAQQGQLMLLDEPTSALDLAHQYDLMRRLKRLGRATGCGIVVVLHDINLAMDVADRILALKDGRVFFDRPAAAAGEAGTLSALYGIALQVVDLASSGRKFAVVQ